MGDVDFMLEASLPLLLVGVLLTPVQPQTNESEGVGEACTAGPPTPCEAVRTADLG